MLKARAKKLIQLLNLLGMAGAENIKAVANPGCVTGAEKIKCVVNALRMKFPTWLYFHTCERDLRKCSYCNLFSIVWLALVDSAAVTIGIHE